MRVDGDDDDDDDGLVITSSPNTSGKQKSSMTSAEQFFHSQHVQTSRFAAPPGLLLGEVIKTPTTTSISVEFIPALKWSKY